MPCFGEDGYPNTNHEECASKNKKEVVSLKIVVEELWVVGYLDLNPKYKPEDWSDP